MITSTEVINRFGVKIDDQLEAIVDRDAHCQDRTEEERELARTAIDFLKQAYLDHRQGPDYSAKIPFGHTDSVAGDTVRELRVAGYLAEANWIEANPAACLWSDEHAYLTLQNTDNL